jgi:hypothetical protein
VPPLLSGDGECDIIGDVIDDVSDNDDIADTPFPPRPPLPPLFTTCSAANTCASRFETVAAAWGLLLLALVLVAAAPLLMGCVLRPAQWINGSSSCGTYQFTW